MRNAEDASAGPAIRDRSVADELTPERYVTAVHGLEVYVVDARTAPATMNEIGRIREAEFSREGGGSGKALDIDEYDTRRPRYRQLLAWDPAAGEIVSMYRFIYGAEIDRERYRDQLATAHLFTFSNRFLADYLPVTIELGRSVVNRQAKQRLKGLFAVWAGLGALVREYPSARYFFGKFTMFPGYHPEARRLLHQFIGAWFHDESGLVLPRERYCVHHRHDGWERGESFDADLKRLVEGVSEYGEAVPPLVLTYSRLTERMRSFGTACNPRFGKVEETAILVPIEHIRPKITNQFVDRYEPINSHLFHRAD